MIQFSEDAVKKVLQVINQEIQRKELGIRIIAEQMEDTVEYQMFWEETKQKDDTIFNQEGLKIFIDSKSRELVEDTVVFLTEQEGQEGLFIMKNTSNCASCSTNCF